MLCLAPCFTNNWTIWAWPFVEAKWSGVSPSYHHKSNKIEIDLTPLTWLSLFKFPLTTSSFTTSNCAWSDAKCSAELPFYMMYLHNVHSIISIMLTGPSWNKSIFWPCGDDHCISCWTISLEPLLAAEISGEKPFYISSRRKFDEFRLVSFVLIAKFSPKYLHWSINELSTLERVSGLAPLSNSCSTTAGWLCMAA